MMSRKSYRDTVLRWGPMGSYASYRHEVEHKPLELQRTRRSMDTMGTRAIRCVLGWSIKCSNACMPKRYGVSTHNTGIGVGVNLSEAHRQTHRYMYSLRGLLLQTTQAKRKRG